MFRAIYTAHNVISIANTPIRVNASNVHFARTDTFNAHAQSRAYAVPQFVRLISANLSSEVHIYQVKNVEGGTFGVSGEHLGKLENDSGELIFIVRV